MGRPLGRLQTRLSLRQTRIVLVDDRDMRALSRRFAVRADEVVGAPVGADILLALIDAQVTANDGRRAEVLATEGSMRSQ